MPEPSKKQQEEALERQAERMLDWDAEAVTFISEEDPLVEELNPDDPLPPDLLEALRDQAEELGLPRSFVER